MIKENRTYDQVLGNIGKGDGDPALTLFNDDSAPNHRELARRFTLFDNFFADADVSADGLSWTVSAGVSDYIDKTWPITYSPGARRRHRARDFENVSFAEQFLTEPLAFDRTIFRGAAALTRGYLWDNAYRDGVSFRDYGFYTRIPGICRGGGNTSDITHLDDRRFGDHVDELYPGFNLECSDHADRYPEWEREFGAYESAFRANPSKDPLPALTIMRLPNDHTYGTVPNKAIPESYFADNDLALGKLVDRVSHSPFWPNTAILVTEDDAQNGPDHVDAHRTLAYVISPYTQTGGGRQHPLRHGRDGRDRRVAAEPAADDDRRPARDADVEGLLEHAELPPLRRADAEGDPVRGGGGADQRADGAAGERVVAVELHGRGRDAGDPAQRGDLEVGEGPQVGHAGAAPRLHHRVPARGPCRLTRALALLAVITAVASFVEGTVALAAAFAAAGVLVLRDPRSAGVGDAGRAVAGARRGGADLRLDDLRRPVRPGVAGGRGGGGRARGAGRA